MTTKYLDNTIIKIVDELPDEAIEELLTYIYEKRGITPTPFLNETNLKRILHEDDELLEKLAE